MLLDIDNLVIPKKMKLLQNVVLKISINGMIECDSQSLVLLNASQLNIILDSD